MEALPYERTAEDPASRPKKVRACLPGPLNAFSFVMLMTGKLIARLSRGPCSKQIRGGQARMMKGARSGGQAFGMMSMTAQKCRVLVRRAHRLESAKEENAGLIDTRLLDIPHVLRNVAPLAALDLDSPTVAYTAHSCVATMYARDSDSEGR